MRYYSEMLGKLFDDPNELNKAEKEAKKAGEKKKKDEERKAAERKTRAAEIETARKAMEDAKKQYNDLVNAFVKDFGSYHCTITTGFDNDLIDTLFKIW